jgi:hypothetical protein
MIEGRVGWRRVRHLRWSINGLKKKPQGVNRYGIWEQGREYQLN